jgi:hypothetical protein
VAVVAIAWIVLALGATQPVLPEWLQPALITLPIALSWLCGVGFVILKQGFQWIFRAGSQTVSAILVIALAINFLLPPVPDLTYLEYDIAARETLALNTRFTARRWMLIAPPEQLSQTLGDGWYSDLAEFVDRYGNRVKRPFFNLPFSVPDIFVFVEKRAFQTFAVEPSTVPAATAFDPVYVNYRALAGRSSLQFAALDLCETYRQTHPDTTIEYEDDTLRVYHFKLPEQLPED